MKRPEPSQEKKILRFFFCYFSNCSKNWDFLITMTQPLSQGTYKQVRKIDKR